ncbi:hypothetical protein GWA97_05320 [Flavobacterium sp. LaA7.5]|nr:hypothetical protein [Flavobacterium salilacus subsp. altitudinum]
MKKIIIFSLAFLSLTACSDEDTNANIAPVETISEGGLFGNAENPINVGGPNQQNQVYVNLSEAAALPVARESWDLGFYSGNDFRVVINGSLLMAVKQLETSDITVRQNADPSVAVGTFQVENLEYVDNPDGSLSGTAFGTIATSEEAAKVYLVNMGNHVPDTAPAAGSVNTAGDPRGWKKVKIWHEGETYKMQYGDIDVAEYTEVEIAKTPGYNHTFFSFTTGGVVNAEPEAAKWDMNFTTFTNEVFDGSGASAGAYFYSDFIVTNTKAGVTAFMVEGDSAAYETFTMETLNAGNYTFSSDQRAIGANWRNVIPLQLYDDVFFVLKDGAGNVYKIKFISMLNTDGERGFPLFQYKLL